LHVRVRSRAPRHRVDFIRALRRRPVLGRTPVVLRTAESDDSNLMRDATALGAAAVVKRPWSRARCGRWCNRCWTLRRG